MEIDLKPCWKCGSPGVISENGGYMFVVCTKNRGCSNAGDWGFDVDVWNRGGVAELQELRKHVEAFSKPCSNQYLLDTLSDLRANARCDAEKIEELEATVNELYNYIHAGDSAPDEVL
jgi:ssDNA-binding Zn-finger/Zn-ribbon topoisomerase 1